MQLSFEILDHIFSFLVSHRETLIACSKDPVLSPIVERQLYYQVIVHIGGESANTFKPDHLSKLVTENPPILSYVRILQIHVEDDDRCRDYLDEFSDTLLKFPVLQCIELFTFDHLSLPDVFRAALENRLNLPTVKEVHLFGDITFPISLLDNCKNLKNLSLLGYSEGLSCASSHPGPQLHSLSLLSPFISPSLLNWLKLHIKGLRSLRCALPHLELLGECSGTLIKLHVCFSYWDDCCSTTGGIQTSRLPKLSLVSPVLEQLTIRTAAIQIYNADNILHRHLSWLPAAADVINLFISSLPHLILDVDLQISTASDLTDVDLSPLAVLGSASLSIRIDLYIHTGVFSSALTHAKLLSSLEGYVEVVRLIKEGVLVIHSEETAPYVY